jgi:uncharacterized membrane protein YozB (DUF420 family)
MLSPMTANLVFWSGALVNLALVCVLALRGVQLARQQEFPRHRRQMFAVSGLVLFFLVSYVVKLAFLGKEDLTVWSPSDVLWLRIHETCVGVMLVAGATALVLGRRFARTQLVDPDSEAPPPPARLCRLHRVVGRIAVFGAVSGFATAAAVLAGMFARA